MSRLQRALFRLFYYPIVLCLKPLDLLFHQFYNLGIAKLIKLGGVNIHGTPRYISSDVYIDSFKHIELGNDIVISKKVTFLTHDYSITTAYTAVEKKPKKDIQIMGRIKIGNNVFIGLGTTILPGTIVGNNVIIGARSVIKGNIPSNVVVAGNPAKVIMTMNDYLERKSKNFHQLEIFHD